MFAEAPFKYLALPFVDERWREVPWVPRRVGAAPVLGVEGVLRVMLSELNFSQCEVNHAG